MGEKMPTKCGREAPQEVGGVWVWLGFRGVPFTPIFFYRSECRSSCFWFLRDTYEKAQFSVRFSTLTPCQFRHLNSF